MPITLSPNSIDSSIGAARNPITIISEFITQDNQVVINVDISGQVDDYSPLLWNHADVVLITSTGDAQISGLDSSSEVKVKKFINKNTVGTITLLNNDSSSSSINRFDTGGRNFNIYPQTEVDVEYDTSILRWEASFANPRPISNHVFTQFESTLAASVTNLFVNNYPPFNLNIGMKFVRVGPNATNFFFVAGADPNLLNGKSTRERMVTVVHTDRNSVVSPMPTGASYIVPNEDSAVTASNRIRTPNQNSIVVEPRDSFRLFYDSTLERWVMM